MLAEAERRHDPAVPDLPRPMIPFSPDVLPGLCAMQASGLGGGGAGARACGRGLQAGATAPPGLGAAGAVSSSQATRRCRCPLPASTLCPTPSLPPPLPTSSPSSSSPLPCSPVKQEAFKPIVKAAEGFQYLPERPEAEGFMRQKWGWRGTQPGAPLSAAAAAAAAEGDVHGAALFSVGHGRLTSAPDGWAAASATWQLGGAGGGPAPTRLVCVPWQCVCLLSLAS